jgi:hypothetical protein
MTFFKSVFDPYVNFALESMETSLNGQPDFGRKAQVDIQRNGDLVTNMLLEVDMPELACAANEAIVDGTPVGVSWAPNLGHALIQETCINIGGVDIDRHYGIWWDAWMALTLPVGKRLGYNQMIGQQNLDYVAGTPNSVLNNATPVTVQTQGNQTAKNGIVNTSPETDPIFTSHPAQRLYIPLKFWFNCNPGLALPLIALQFHQVRLQVKFRPVSELVVLTCAEVEVPPAPPALVVPEVEGGLNNLHIENVCLWVTYVFLDNDARQHYAQNPHEYLIKQLQFNCGESVTGSAPKLDLRFNHPTTELMLWFQEDAAVQTDANGCGGNQWNFYAIFDTTGPVSGSASDAPEFFAAQPVAQLKLRLNGQDRYAFRTGDWHNLVQPYFHHSNIAFESEDQLDTRYRGLQVYSFALDPEDQQPNGTTNFSRIDTATICANLVNIGSGNPGVAYIFGINYNFFRVAGGMGGVAFAA